MLEQPQQSPVTISNRVMRGPTGASYTLTDDDLLWLARAVKSEAGTHAEGGAAVCWALAQNYMMLGANPPRLATFTALIRAYCQPLNPIWMSLDGAGCRHSPGKCTPADLQRRQAHASRPWTSIEASIRDTVTRFAAGTLPNPIPNLTDWHADRYANAVREIGGNWFGYRSGRRRTA